MSDERMDPVQHMIQSCSWLCGACAEHGTRTENHADRHLCRICGASRAEQTVSREAVEAMVERMGQSFTKAAVRDVVAARQPNLRLLQPGKSIVIGEPPVPTDEDYLATSAVHDGALLAFATNFELIKKLAKIIGWENVPAEGREVMRNYLALIVDGADGFVEQATEEDGPTTELTTLFREITEARDWLAAHMETE